jgi:hypothetical protein
VWEAELLGGITEKFSKCGRSIREIIGDEVTEVWG